ncbi:MAG TPA: hypothetical protein VH143_13075 [Kofleriaceae bacterium]|nr:hypothetical protein [Kofleriaceae bacterium]
MDEAERLYRLRKLGVDLDALEAPPQLASQRAADAGEQLRLDLELRTGAAAMRGIASLPAIEELLALGGNDVETPLLRIQEKLRKMDADQRVATLAWAKALLPAETVQAFEGPLTTSVAARRRAGWLLFAYGGPDDIIEDAMNVVSPVAIAAWLRSFDPMPNDHRELANRMQGEITERERDAAVLRAVDARQGLAEKIRAPVRVELAAVEAATARKKKTLEFHKRRASVAPMRAGMHERPSRTLTLEMTTSRRKYSRVLHALDIAGWTPLRIAELVLTGMGALLPDGSSTWFAASNPREMLDAKGWAFPLCPWFAMPYLCGGKKKLANAISKEIERSTDDD